MIGSLLTVETNCSLSKNIESDLFITKNGRKLESVETKIRDIFIHCFLFNKTIIPLTLVGYELMIVDSVLRTLSAI